MNKSANYPTLSAVIDYGLQGEKYDLNNLNEQDYMMASLILKWDIFHGLQNQSKMQQALIDQQIIENRYDELTGQIKLQVINSYYDLKSCQSSIISGQDEVKSLESAFYIVNKKYENGQANLLQYIDARTAMTNAKQKLIFTQYDYLIKLAEFEKITAAYQF